MPQHANGCIKVNYARYLIWSLLRDNHRNIEPYRFWCNYFDHVATTDPVQSPEPTV